MTHPRFSFVVLVLTLVLSTGYARSQQDKSTSALREKAFSLLESVAGQVDTLQSPENRARLRANIVDSIWKHDEKRARSLLVLVEEDIKAGLENSGGLDESDRLTFMVFSKLRVDTVERIAKHDGELALAFLKATKPISDQQLRFGHVEKELALQSRLANKIAVHNPELALKLGRQSLAQGFSTDLISLLRQMNRKNREQAQIFYKEIVYKLRDANLASGWEIREFVHELARSFKPPAADHSTFRELVAVVTTSALANGCEKRKADNNEFGGEPDFCRSIAALIPDMETIDPRAARLKHWKPHPSEWEVAYEANREWNELVQDATVEELLALAINKPEHADETYWYATQKARANGDFEQARKIANDYVANEESRRDILAQLDQDQRRATVDDQRLEEVQTRLSAIPQIQARIRFLLSVSGLFGASNQKAALKLLRQASEIADTMKPGKEQTEAQMALAVSYCLEKNDRGLAIMESLVPKLNELIDVATKLDGYETGYLREGEWNMSENGAVGALLTRLAQNAGYFAWCDFDRSVSLAGQFQRAEIRLMAQLKLAQGILAGPPKRVWQDY